MDTIESYRDHLKARPLVTILATIGAIYVGHLVLTQKSRFMETCMEDSSKRQCEAEWEHYEYESDPSNGAR